MRNLSHFKIENFENIRLLNQTIESFNGAALKFETYYRLLEKRIKKLNLELKIKNEELTKNLKEKDEIKNYLHNILESLTTGVVVIDPAGNITTFNRAAEEITGLSSKKVTGKDFDSTFTSTLFLESLKHLGITKGKRQNVSTEVGIIHNKKGPIHVNLSTFPVKNQQKEKVGTAITLQDITELKRLEKKANRTDRLAAMGEMAAEIAHEIRNPLGSIELFATTLKKDLEGTDELEAIADHISSGVRRLNNIISNLLLFVRPEQKPELHLMNICQPLNDALIFSKNLVLSEANEIDIITEFPPEPLMVHGDQELLMRAYLNLILNAIQAMPDGGKLTISARKSIRTPESPNYACIHFRDTGIGVSGSDLPNIFDPFYTTKNKGMGLGLAIVHNIIKLHSGDVDIECFEDAGTGFTVRLPLCEDENGAK
jgi:two-component system sensor histidine kinase FlrB